jgi:uncharacterized protein (DUF1501 family)
MVRPRSLPSRRDILRAASLSAFSLTLPELLRSRSACAAEVKPAADACIFVFLWGAPSQFETFDPKPEAPDGIRGEFGTLATRLPGVLFGEHVPMLAARNDRFSIIRTCAQTSTHHQSAAYEALTGYPPSRDAVALTATPTDHPNLGSIAARFAPGQSMMPRFVQLPQLASDVGNLTPGQFAGFLGRRFDPLTVLQDPSNPRFDIAELTLPPEVSTQRLHEREGLQRLMDQRAFNLDQSAPARALGVYQERAVRLLASPEVKRAFDLSLEPASLRERYGADTLGQSLLLARRLVEAGVKLVTVCSGFNGKTPQDAWDTHSDNFKKLKNRLLPPLDRGLSALLDDMSERGLGQRTLLVAMGEFGRTPAINKAAGRDHWHHCYPALFAGGGIRPGIVLGRSDHRGAYPVDGKVCSPADLCATVYRSLGIDHHAEMADQTGKPVAVTKGQPIQELL